MTVVYSQARDEMFTLFNDAWQLNSAALAGYIPQIRWQGKEELTKPDNSKYWARVSIQSVLERQATLSVCEGEPGQKKYESSGLVFIQVFAPKSIATAYDVGQKLAEVARNAYRGKETTSRVWFRNVRINTLAPEELFYRFNVIAEYEFYELG